MLAHLALPVNCQIQDESVPLKYVIPLHSNGRIRENSELCNIYYQFENPTRRAQQ